MSRDNEVEVSENTVLAHRIVYTGLAVLALIILWAIWPIYTVPTGMRGVVTVGGKITGIHSEGYAILAPWQKLTVFNVRAEAATIEKAEGATSDLQPVHVSLTVRYNIAPDRVSEVFEKYTRNGDLQPYVETATQEVFKAVTARYTAPELIAKREQVSTDIFEGLAKRVSIYGAHVIDINIRTFAFSDTYMAAINQKATQEQLRQAADNRLKTVESEQKQKVAVAMAEADARRAEADGTAYARLKNATAESQALDLQGQAIARNPQVLELRRIEVAYKQAGTGWNGQLPTQMYGSVPLPFMQVPAATAGSK